MSLEVAFEAVEGSEFHAVGPAWEKARSPNFVHIRG